MRNFVLTMMLLSVLTVNAQGFISPQVKIAKRQHEEKAAMAKTRGEVVNANARMQLFVSCAKGANVQEVANATKEAGAQVRVVRGRLIVLDIPYSKVEALADVKGVELISMPPKISKKSDVSRKVTQAVEVNDGTGAKLPQAYTGKGVIVGIIDCGFDPTHPTFKDKDGNLRIKSLYVPGIVDAKGHGEKPTVTYDDGSSETLTGVAYNKSEEILDPNIFSDNSETHGTHCISIAAGCLMDDVKGTSGGLLGGIAPEADIILCDNFIEEDGHAEEVGGDPTAWDFVQCLSYLEYQAEKSKKPLVVSLSENSHMGWHDGTSLTSYYLGEFCKQDGLALMLCAGNEGEEWVYIHPTIEGGDSAFVGCIPVYDGYVWGGMKTEKTVKMQLSLINWTNGKQVSRIPVTFDSDSDQPGIALNFDKKAKQDLDSLSQICYDSLKNYFDAGQLQIYCYKDKAYDSNLKLYTYTQLWVHNNGLKRVGEDEGDVPWYSLVMKLKPEEKTELHAWGGHPASFLFWIDHHNPDITYGSDEVSVGDFNTTGEPVSVGAWCANDKIQYEGTPLQDADHDTSTINDISYFSSYGTDLAGHQHPDVCAPGSNVVAALNSNYEELEGEAIYMRKGYKDQYIGQTGSKDYVWGTMSGTSMATPAAAGVVALWMQAAQDLGKTLTSKDIKDIIAHSSDTDEFTKASPKRFGNGKINAYKGLLYVLGIDTSIPTLSKEQPRNVSFRVKGDIVYADGAEDGTPASIYNLQGVLVSQTAVEDGTLSLAGLPKGVYAVQLGKLGSTLIRK